MYGSFYRICDLPGDGYILKKPEKHNKMQQFGASHYYSAFYKCGNNRKDTEKRNKVQQFWGAGQKGFTFAT